MAISIKRNNINLYQTIAFMQQMVPEIVFCTKQYFDQKKRQNVKHLNETKNKN